MTSSSLRPMPAPEEFARTGIEHVVHPVGLDTPQWALLEDGWWVTRAVGPVQDSGSWQIQSFRGSDDLSVIRRMRVELRTAAAADPCERNRAVWDWTDGGGYRSTLAVLRARQACDVAFTISGRRIGWQLHPVRFLDQVPALPPSGETDDRLGPLLGRAWSRSLERVWARC
jgi:hypothetical protein